MRAKYVVKFRYVYLITNTILNKQYVGSRMCYYDKIEDDIYWGSSKYLFEDIKQFGIENFTKEVLQSDYENKIDLLEGESYYILKYNTLIPNGYNRFIPNKRKGFYAGMTGHAHSEESKSKISNKVSGENNPMFGVEWSEEKKDKMRGIHNPMFKKEPANKGKPRSPETIEKIRQKTREAMHKPETWDKFLKNNKEGKQKS